MVYDVKYICRNGTWISAPAFNHVKPENGESRARSAKASQAERV